MDPDPVPAWLVDTAQHHLIHDTTDPDGFQARLQALEGALVALRVDMDGLGAPGLPEARQEVSAAVQGVLAARARLHSAAQAILSAAGLRS